MNKLPDKGKLGTIFAGTDKMFASFVVRPGEHCDMFIREDGIIEMAVGQPDERNWFELPISQLKQLAAEIDRVGIEYFGQEWGK